MNRGADVVGDNFATSSAMLWPHNAEPVILPLPDGMKRGTAYGINNRDSIVGQYSATDDSQQCFLWTPDQGPVDFGAGQWFDCMASDVNNSNQITGKLAPSETSGSFAFLWNQGKFTNLGTLPGTEISEGVAINDSGEIIGASFEVVDQPRGFIWNGALIDLDPKHQFAADMPLAINNHGVAVGWVRKNVQGGMSAVKFGGANIVHLVTEVTNGQGWELQAATSINDKDVIVGYGLLNGSLHGYLLTPL
jgi:uncharacterized membrane protein